MIFDVSISTGKPKQSNDVTILDICLIEMLEMEAKLLYPYPISKHPFYARLNKKKLKSLARKEEDSKNLFR